MATNPLKYVDVPTAVAPASYVAPTYVAPTYTSRYGEQLDSALKGVTDFSYDPLKDASYQALAKVYSKRGEKAAKNTMADAAMLNGGLSTSYAASAAQQQRNDYNAELASMIPDLEERAYNRNVQTLAALGDAEDRDYGRYRDTVGDTQWKYEQDNENAKWKYSQDYQAYRDTVADSQWARNYNLDIYGLLQAEKKGGGGGGGGGGGRRGGGGGGGGYAGSGSSGNGSAYATAAKVAKGAIDVSKKKYNATNKATSKQIKKAGIKTTKGKTDPNITVSKASKKLKGGGGHAVK